MGAGVANESAIIVLNPERMNCLEIDINRRKRDYVNILCKPADCARKSGMEIIQACGYANLPTIRCKAWHDTSTVVTCGSWLKP